MNISFLDLRNAETDVLLKKKIKKSVVHRETSFLLRIRADTATAIMTFSQHGTFSEKVLLNGK